MPEVWSWRPAEWVSACLERTKHSFHSAQSQSDRLVLLRTWAHLLGGRIDLSPNGLSLSPDDLQGLRRFGLGLTNGGQTVRLLEEEEARNVIGLPEALQFEGRVRQQYEPATADGALLRHTEHTKYRSVTQKAAIRALLTQPPGSGLMVSMPTGSGKSLLFQMAAKYERSLEPGACSIVITPTVALALDHQRTLQSFAGLEGSRAVVGDMPRDELEKVINGFRRGDVPVLFLSPERALHQPTLNHLFEAAKRESVEYGLDARLTHLFVDEAHIVESWGRSFRPDFQRLPAVLEKLREANPELRAVLLSATLTEASRRVLRSGWRLDGEWLEIDAHAPRYEHDIAVQHFMSHAARDEALDFVVDRAPRPAIVYTTKVEHAANLANRLRSERGYGRVALFTGETGADERSRVIKAWAEDDYDLVVATSAFGMGIDKPGVRSVIHACLPEGPARWYQEIGRSARDGGQGLAVCLFTVGQEDSDEALAKRLATSGWLGRELASARWKGLLNAAGPAQYSGEHAQLRMNLDAFREGLRPREGDWNRGWNMSLLTLMQRAGVISILSVETKEDQAEFVWHIEVQDPRLLNGTNDEVWDLVSNARNEEVREAQSSLGAFFRAMRHPQETCVMRMAFELIETDSFSPRCGRCPGCRSDGVLPPERVPAHGLATVWQPIDCQDVGLPAGQLVINPRDHTFEHGLSDLVVRLARVGIQQFVVPENQADKTAEELSRLQNLPGLVLSDREWVGDTSLAWVPTAVLLPANDREATSILDRASLFAKLTGTPVLVVGQPDRRIRGRRLDQTMSDHAPYSEAALDEFSTSEELNP